MGIESKIKQHLGYVGDLNAEEQARVQAVKTFMNTHQIADVKTAISSMSSGSASTAEKAKNPAVEVGSRQHVKNVGQSGQVVSGVSMTAAFTSGALKRAQAVVAEQKGEAMFQEAWDAYVATGAMPEDPQLAALVQGVAATAPPAPGASLFTQDGNFDIAVEDLSFDLTAIEPVRHSQNQLLLSSGNS